MKKYLSPALTGLLSAYALCACFHAPLNRAFYGETADYLTASVYELLGEYSFALPFIWLLCAALFYVLARKGYSFSALLRKPNKGNFSWLILSCFFGLTFELGNILSNADTDGFFTSSFVNGLKYVLASAGITLLCFPLICFIRDRYLSFEVSGESKKSFWSDKPLIKAFLLLFVCYLPFLILSFPGNLCYDVIGQIEQGLSGSYTTHHPLIHTLWVSGMVKLGEKLFASREIGLFLYVLMQTALLLLAFAASIAFLARKKVRPCLLWGLFVLYLFTPIYTNLATTAVKDIPFTAFVLLYVIAYSAVLSNPELIRKSGVHLTFVAVQIGAIVMRNNGLPLIVLSGIAAVVFLIAKKRPAKEIFLSVGAFFVESLILSELILLLVSGALHAGKGSKGEIFSLPFQQTAYTLSVCGNTITQDERASIENILGDTETIVANYDKDIADPVKALYRKDATGKDLFGYIKAYLKMGAKHPVLYGKAFVRHTYGWYCAGVPNEIRYETEYDGIRHGMAFANADKVMVFFYRFANRLPFPGILENIGAAVWCLIFLTAALLKQKKGTAIMTFPLWVSFLICLASPCFFKHPRYALPILACLPFVLCFAKGDRHVK